MNRSEFTPSTSTSSIDRRQWLAGVMSITGTTALSRNLPGQNSEKITDTEKKRVEELFIRFEQSGLSNPKALRNDRFVVVSNARPEFVRQVLHIAEDTAATYNRYISSGRMPVRFDNTRMLIIVLANAGQYNKFMDDEKSRNEGGHFDLDENWTVTFDHRGRTKSTKSVLERSNQVTLIHELTHQVSYNTGLLNINSDTPMLVSEGLATLAEPAAMALTPGFGQINKPRVAVMSRIMSRNPKAFIPLRELITTDDAFFAEDDPTLQMAYGQAWLFWNTVMNTPEYSGKMPVYLKRIEGRLKPDRRLDDFVASFGSTANMESAMYQSLQDLMK